MDLLPQFEQNLWPIPQYQPRGMVGSKDNDRNERTLLQPKQFGKAKVAMCVTGYFKQDKPFPLSDHGTK